MTLYQETFYQNPLNYNWWLSLFSLPLDKHALMATKCLLLLRRFNLKNENVIQNPSIKFKECFAFL
jgi:hypothetical protein